MPVIDVKYSKTDPRTGRLIYRRRVPKHLQAFFPGQTMLVKSLGNGTDAIVAYGKFHEHIEHLLALAKGGVAGLSPVEQQNRLKAMLKAWGADPHSTGVDENERTWREEAAGQLVDRYQDARTGEYVGVPADVSAIAGALVGGVSAKQPEPTITDAFRFYLEEKAKTIPEQRKKQEQRFRRAEKNLITAVGSDKLVSKLTREDARKWRDMRTGAGASPATIRREKNDLSAVIGLAKVELDADGDNPFSRLNLPKTPVSRQDQREALPPEVIEGVYRLLEEKRPDLLPIWTLLDFTGARPSEIRELLVSEVVLEHPVPHIIIRERADRTLKTTWSARTVPLVGAALDTARAAIKGVKDPSAPVFPRFHGERGLDKLSQALRTHVRALTENKKHVPYSLRHNMKDRLRAAEIYRDTQTAIQGHSSGKGEDANYGGPVPLEQKREALEKALKGYRSGHADT